MNEQEKERLLDLLTDRVLFGLSAEQEKELKSLEEKYPDIKNDDSFDLTAGIINLTSVEKVEPMPEHLRERILANADEFFGKKNQTNVVNFQPKRREIEERTTTANVFSEKVSNVAQFTPKRSLSQWLGWAVAAAACLVLAVNLWMTRPAPVSAPPAPLTMAQQREQLMRESADVVKAEWSEADPNKQQKITGDVVWSDGKQKGYMLLRGFPKNDASKETYQLWIFDANQDDKTPIDGGVFDVNENGEVIVPIDAKIKVINPKMFAVTAEKPGGVVVSKREKMISIAKVSA